MGLFTIDLKPESLGKTLSGSVKHKNLIEFLKGIPQEKISGVVLYVNHCGVVF